MLPKHSYVYLLNNVCSYKKDTAQDDIQPSEPLHIGYEYYGD